jgi:hypothetical protein
VLSERIHPDILFKFRVSDTNMTGHAFCEALSGEVTEDCRSVNKNVLSVFFMTWKCWYAYIKNLVSIASTKVMI